MLLNARQYVVNVLKVANLCFYLDLCSHHILNSSGRALSRMMRGMMASRMALAIDT